MEYFKASFIAGTAFAGRETQKLELPHR